MANADFSQKQNSTSGGFDAGSYREQKQPEQAVPLTPLQQQLALAAPSCAAGTTKSANGTRWVWRQTTAITSTRS